MGKFHVTEICEKGKIENTWLPLQKCKTGEIFVSAEYTPIAEKDENSSTNVLPEEPRSENKQKSKSEAKLSQFKPGNILFTIHEARNLEKKGLIGKPDPYVFIKFGKETFTSKTIKNQYNPAWEFNVKLDVKEIVENLVFLEVFDEDIGKDDSLGKTCFEI